MSTPWTPKTWQPESFEEEVAAPPPSGISSVGQGLAQAGTAGLADELIGLARATGPGRDAQADSDLGMPYRASDEKTGDFFADYRAGRDEAREADRAAQGNRGAYLAGNVGGGLATAGLAPAASGAGGILARIFSGAKTAAPVGATFGAGMSEADTLPGLLKDIGLGGAGGAALGGALPAAGAAISRAATPVTDWLRGVATEQGRKVLTGNAGTISVKRPLSDGAVQEALRQGAIKPFGTTQAAAEVLGEAREAAGARYSGIVEELERRGVTGPDATALGMKLLERADDAAANTAAASPTPRMFRAEAESVTEKALADGPAAGTLPLSRAENIKRSLQSRGKYHKISGESDADEAFRDMASVYRQSVEDAIEAQASKAPEEAAAFVPVKQQLGRLIEGADAAETAAARQSRNRGISLSDTVAGSAGAAAGGWGGAALLALLNKVHRTRGPATLSWAADRTAALTGPLASNSSAATSPGVRGALTPELELALQKMVERWRVSAGMAEREEDR